MQKNKMKWKNEKKSCWYGAFVSQVESTPLDALNDYPSTLAIFVQLVFVYRRRVEMWKMIIKNVWKTIACVTYHDALWR